MEYQKYIDLGFVREDESIEDEFRKTGYYGFFLQKEITKNQFISVNSSRLSKPNLCIKVANCNTHHVIPISTQIVIDLCSND